MNTVEETIQKCIGMIEQTNIVAGVGNRIAAPMVSVILGREAEENLPTIKATYESYWASRADHLSYWIGTYRAAELEDACVDALVKGKYMDPLARDNIRAAVYWDLMDDRFEEIFEAVKQPFEPPCPHSRVFFIFCKQLRSEERIITKERMERVLQWAEETDSHLVVLSNQSAGGIYGDDEIAQNYKIAAMIQFLMNAASSDEDNMAQMARELEFNLQNNRLWTVGYANCPRKYRDIIHVSLLQILERIYENANAEPESVKQKESVKSSGDEYIDLLDHVFAEKLEPLCPGEEDRRFWEDLPRTADMEALARLLSGEEEPVRGPFWRRLLPTRKDDSWQNAIPSVQELWDVCVKTYYLDPIRQWLSTEKGHRAISRFFNNHFAGELSLREMAQLAGDVQRLRTEEQYLNPVVGMPDPSASGKQYTLAGYLHECACCAVKQEIYRDMIRDMAAAMEHLSVRAKNFKPLMDTVLPSFRGVSVAPGIRDAYGPHMRRLLDANMELITQQVLPCANEEELLAQVEGLFRELANRDPERRYFATLQGDIKFQIANGNAAASANVITDCFGMDLKSMGRFRSYRQESGHLYCIMNNTMTELMSGVKTENIGKRFIVNRSDRIERIYLYPIIPKDVEYRCG